MNGIKEQKIRDGAYNLYDGGWRSTDRQDLIEEYGLSEEEVDIIIDELKKIEDRQEVIG